MGAGLPAAPAAAIVLAGGRGSRMGGRDKPALGLHGSTLLQIALDAVGRCPVVVVGPPRELPDGVRSVLEDPPGAGPAAAVAAGLAALPDGHADGLVAVLAADLPGITAATIGRLCAAAAAEPAGALLVDASGRRQNLTGVWRYSALRAAVAARPDWAGRSLRELLAPLTAREIAGEERETADVDTPADWARWGRHDG
jgi:molybdopterin-guanine dinucleotide biosynthesis protein A